MISVNRKSMRLWALGTAGTLLVLVLVFLAATAWRSHYDRGMLYSSASHNRLPTESPVSLDSATALSSDAGSLGSDGLSGEQRQLLTPLLELPESFARSLARESLSL
jgi:hypothetical protein